MNLTQTQSIEKYRKDYKQPDYIIVSTRLIFRLEALKTIVHSKLSFTKNPAKKKQNDELSTLTLNGENLKLLELKLDGVSLPRASYYQDKKHLSITDLPEQFSLEMITKLKPHKNTHLQGLYKSGNKFCTQCEAEGFRNITYYLDRPDVMATFTTRIEADKKAYPYLLSNGNLIDSGDLDNERHFCTWHDPFPKPSYLFALVAGDFDLLRDTYTTSSGREVALEIYVDKSKKNQCHHAMNSLKKAMKWDEDIYNLEYDLDIYMIVAVSDFNMGAMENKGLNIFNTCYVLANDKTATDADFEGVESVIAHEYFHNWTGNRVTCRDWFQLSLKEGLTVFRDQEFSSDMNSRAVKRVEDARFIRIHQFAEDTGPMAHPVRPDSYIEMNNFYTVTVYHKGAEVIRMIHTLLGGERFQLGMALYFKRHDGQAVTCEDFIKSMEDANDVDFQQFRNWYSQAGTPEVEIFSQWDDAKGLYSVSFHQDCPATPNQNHKEVFFIPVKMALFNEKGELLPLNPDQKDVRSNAVIELSGNDSEVIIALANKQQTITFSGLDSEPHPSFLRGFSAPVKLAFNYTDEQLSLLLASDNDSYAKWDAGQLLMTRVILKLTDALVKKQPLVNPDNLLRSLKMMLDNSDVDPSLRAMILKIPGLDFLIEQFEEIPFDELVIAHNYLNQYLARNLQAELLNNYKMAPLMANKEKDRASGWRSLQNTCLSILAKAGEEGIELAIKQFNQSRNMTNSLAAMMVIAHSKSQTKIEVLDRFYHHWQDEELVIDKWFAVQAKNPNSDALDEVEKLFEHADFELSNPNKVRALLMSFAKGNLINFHRKDGGGYELIGDMIIKLNKVNPQIAARITSSFNHWRKFDGSRGHLMQSQLKRLLEQDNVSTDVYEIASKALA